MLTTMPNEIDLLVTPGFSSLEMAGFLSALSAANKYMLSNGPIEAYRFRIISYEEGIVPSDSVMCVSAQSINNAGEGSDTLVIAGSKDHHESLLINPYSFGSIKTTFPRAKRIAALLSGTPSPTKEFNLQENKPSQTKNNFANISSHVELEYDSPQLKEDKIWTSYSLSSAIEIALKLIAMDYGDDMANKIKKSTSIYKYDLGGIPHSPGRALASEKSTKIREIRKYIERNLDKGLTVENIAKRHAMSTRNLNRIFSKDIGISPSMYIEFRRLEKAINLIMETNLPLKTIAFKSGFSSSQKMRRSFIKHTSMTPGNYRKSYHAENQPDKPLTNPFVRGEQ
ncbi:hypothetical protein DKQ62_04540 [Halomonas elongata]|nr:hypothetical protein DKQ62_04540 [Halomonas elongata]